MPIASRGLGLGDEAWGAGVGEGAVGEPVIPPDGAATLALDGGAAGVCAQLNVGDRAAAPKAVARRVVLSPEPAPQARAQGAAPPFFSKFNINPPSGSGPLGDPNFGFMAPQAVKVQYGVFPAP